MKQQINKNRPINPMKTVFSLVVIQERVFDNYGIAVAYNNVNIITSYVDKPIM